MLGKFAKKLSRKRNFRGNLISFFAKISSRKMIQFHPFFKHKQLFDNYNFRNFSEFLLSAIRFLFWPLKYDRLKLPV